VNTCKLTASKASLDAVKRKTWLMGPSSLASQLLSHKKCIKSLRHTTLQLLNLS
jgi:hypothetical protein